MSHVHDASCQQLEVYAAEGRVPTGRALTVEELQPYVNELRESDWWQRNFAMVHFIEAQPRPASYRGGSVGSWKRDLGAGLIEMAPVHMTERDVLHEVSHVLAAARYGSRSHDPWFARTYLELVFIVLGSETYLALRAAFEAGGVDFDTDSGVPAGIAL